MAARFIAHLSFASSEFSQFGEREHESNTIRGAGYDQVDVHACTEHGIKVSNTPTAVDDATADNNMFLILGALRGFNSSMFALRRGEWKGNPAPPLGHDPQGKTLGILGMGGIGRNLKKKAEVFGMKVIYHNRNRLSEKESGGAEYVEFDELLKRSDVLSTNLPLNVSEMAGSVSRILTSNRKTLITSSPPRSLIR